jgi:hypothetical protein
MPLTSAKADGGGVKRKRFFEKIQIYLHNYTKLVYLVDI